MQSDRPVVRFLVSALLCALQALAAVPARADESQGIPVFAERFLQQDASGRTVEFHQTDIEAAEYVANEFIVLHEEEPVLKKVRRGAKGKLKGKKGRERQQLKRIADDAAARIDGEKRRFADRLRRSGVDPGRKVKKQYKKAINASILRDIAPAEAKRLRADGVVLHPVPRFRISLYDSVSLIGAPLVRQELDLEGNPIDGSGVSVGIIDTGIDFTHPDFGSCTLEQFNAGTCEKVRGGVNFVTPGSPPLDDNGHGTHVAGTVGGDHALQGVAPGVHFYALKVCNSGGSCGGQAILDAIEWAADPNGDGDFSDHLDVINLSLGGRGNPDDAFSTAIDAVVDAGVVAVVSAGNSGPGPQTIGSPGTSRSAITVGAAYPRDLTGGYWYDTDPRVDQVTSFSSRGPVIWDTSKVINKPDVIAPGGLICAAKASAIPATRPECLPGYVAMSGTSMSAPHAAGAAALLLAKYPSWTPREVKAALVQTAKDITNPATGASYPIATQGYGRIEVARAAALVNGPIVAEVTTVGVLRGASADLEGTATGPDFLGYAVAIRHTDSNEWVEIAAASAPVDGGVLGRVTPDLLKSGRYEVRLTVTTAAESRSVYAYFEVRNSEISRPASLRTASTGAERVLVSTRSLITIRGSSAPGNFSSYSLDLCTMGTNVCSNSGVALANGGLAPVRDGVLGTLDLRGDPSFTSGLYDLRLMTRTTGGGYEITRNLIYLDTALTPDYPKDFWLSGGSGLYLTLFAQPVVSDLDGDGAHEVLFNYSGRFDARNAAFDSLPGWPYVFPNTNNQVPPSAADLEGDGVKESVERYYATTYAIGHDGAPAAGFPRTIPFTNFTNSFVPHTLADLDGDGEREMIDSELRAVDRNGKIPDGWDPAIGLAPSEHRGTWALGVAAGDVDGDGRIEVAAATRESSNALYLFNHDGSLRWSVDIAGSQLSSPLMADLDRDGTLEILLTRSGSASHLEAFRHDGTPVAGFPVELTGPIDGYIAAAMPVPGDFDLDGIPELVVLNNDCISIVSAAGVLRRSICNYRWDFALAAQVANVDSDPEPEVLAAFNGASGIMYGNTAIFQLAAFNADGTYADGFPKILFGLPESWHFPVADIDGDGRNELTLVSDNKVYQWRLNACASTGEDWPQAGGNADFTRVYRPGTRLECELDGEPPASVATPAPSPTSTPLPTQTPVPTSTRTPRPTSTPLSTPTPLPTATPVEPPSFLPPPQDLEPLEVRLTGQRSARGGRSVLLLGHVRVGRRGVEEIPVRLYCEEELVGFDLTSRSGRFAIDFPAPLEAVLCVAEADGELSQAVKVRGKRKERRPRGRVRRR